ncbi:MAG: FAD-binding protein [bacterium]|nr:FAD-binding protein [bacterium]
MAERSDVSGAALVVRLRNLLGAGGLRTDRAAISVHARDASHLDWGCPLAVAMPATADEAANVVALCAAAGVAVVPRGAGTGLSGGAVPPDGAVVLVTSRLRELGQVDAACGAVAVGPGVLNAAVSRHAAPCALQFAPDPSSQAASTIGGNIAENAGGPHCLSVGVTSHHLRALAWCDADGRTWDTGPPVALSRGLDLRGLLCGSEGTLGLVTGAWLQLVPVPESVQTLLAGFPVLEAATAAVPRLLQAGLLPVAVEIIDQAMVATVEEAFGFGLPTDVQAVAIVELAGAATATATQATVAESVLRDAGAGSVRRAVDAAERASLWQCRKRAFGAVGRLSPNYVSMDVVVPLGELPGLVREIQHIRTSHGVRIATAFHAGDGNLHPAVHYDERRDGDPERAHTAADAIIRAALARRGSVTGEHGVGLEKLHVLPWQLDAVTASLMQGLKQAFDPRGTLNPGKALPGRAASGAMPQWAAPPPVPAAPVFAWDDLVVTAPVDVPLAELQEHALGRGLWIPLGMFGQGSGHGLGAGRTVGAAVDDPAAGPVAVARATARELLLEVWAETGDGRPFHAGAPVTKNVAGYDLPRLLCGAGGCLARLQAVTFPLRPAPPQAVLWRLCLPDGGRLPAGLAGALAAVAHPHGGAQIVAEAASGQAWLLAGAGGGDDPQPVASLAAGWGVEATLAWRGPFSAVTGILAEAGVPTWALASPDWTLRQPLPGTGTGGQVPALPRCVWNLPLPLVWAPGPLPVATGWHSEAVVNAGRPAPLPAPPPGVPVALLRRLKRLFDPGGTLGGPDWLFEAADG